jgi:hypothetical protein
MSLLETSMDVLDQFLSLPIFRNSFADWLMALSLSVALFFALLTARRLVRKYHARLTTAA